MTRLGAKGFPVREGCYYLDENCVDPADLWDLCY